MRSLLNEKFTKQRDSTIGADLNKAVCCVEQNSSTGRWEWTRENSEDDRLRRLVCKQLADTVHDLDRSFNEEPSINDGEKRGRQPGGEGAAGAIAFAQSQCQVPEEEEYILLDQVSIRGAPTNVPASKGNGNKNQPSAADLSKAVHCCHTSTEEHLVNPGTVYGTGSEHIDSLLDGITEEGKTHVDQFLEEVTKNPQLLDDLLASNVCFIDIWDFAGQISFAAIQHMLLGALRCAYALLFNSSQYLQSVHESSFCINGIEHHFNLEGQSPTNFDIVQSWLNIIHQVLNGRCSTLCLVGTQIDNVPAEKRDDQKRALEDYIWRTSKGKAYENDIDKVFFVDNTRSGSEYQDEAIVHLRQLLVEKLLKQKEVGVPIPNRWLRFTIAVRWLAKEKGYPWLSLSDARQLAKVVCSLSSNEEADSVLEFHHHLGHILHHSNSSPLCDTVIIDVPWVLRIISLLFVPWPKQKQDKYMYEQYDLLENGILLESLAEHIWREDGTRTSMYTQTPEQRDRVFRLMEEFALLVNGGVIEHDLPAVRKFILPALVSATEDPYLPAFLLDQDDGNPPIHLYCGTRSFFPQTLFWCLVVQCLKVFGASRQGACKTKPHLLRCTAYILYKRCYWVRLHYFQHGIQISMFEESFASDEAGCSPSLDQVCREVLEFAEKQLNQLRGNVFSGLKWRRAIRCRCKISQQPCAKHNTEECSDINCQHFVEFMDDMPRCMRTSEFQQIDDVARIWPCYKKASSLKC